MTAAEYATYVTPFPPPGGIRVVRALSDADFAAVVDIRRRVFGEEQGIVEGSFTDADDERSLVALALRPILTPDGPRPQPVGTGRLTLGFGSRGEALIAWVASLPEARGLGVATATMRYLLAAADAAQAPAVVLAAQRHAEPFYRRFGFVPAGEPYTVRGIAHHWMGRPGTVDRMAVPR